MAGVSRTNYSAFCFRRYGLLVLLIMTAIYIIYAFVKPNQLRRIYDTIGWEMPGRGKKTIDLYEKICVEPTGKNDASYQRYENKCLMPLKNFDTKFRILEKYRLIACAIEKNMSTVIAAILCFLYDEKGFVEANRTITNDAYSTSGLETYKKQYCLDCGIDMRCFIDTLYTRATEFANSTATFKRNDIEDVHFFPQNCLTLPPVTPKSSVIECRDYLKLEYESCSCNTPITVGDALGIRVHCRNLNLHHLSNVNVLFKQEQLTQPTVSTVLITEGALRSVGQDTFKGINLRHIDLSSNSIDAINANAFRGLEPCNQSVQSSLRQLNLQNNEFVVIPSWSFTYLHHLEYLDLRRNRISELTRSTFAEAQLANLHYLHLDDNRIESLAPESLSLLPLQVLTLSANLLFELGEHSLPDSLWHLNLKNNKFVEIPYAAIKGLTRLKVLDLEGNNISTITSHSSVRFDNVALDLLLAGNKIRELEAGAFDSFPAFQRLDLSYNQISKISGVSFRTVTRAQSLDLSNNFISSIPVNTFVPFADSLEVLNLQENRIQSSPAALHPLKILKKLNLNNNHLTSLDNEHFINFKANITELLLASNRLSTTPSDVLQGMHQLHTLDLSKNQISHIDKMAFGTFEGTNGASTGLNLLTLNLAGNQIQEIAHPGTFLYMSSLAHLDLSFNRIRRLTRVALERLENLESFYLHHNDMIEFPRNALSSLNKLRNLLLDHNQILNLPNYAFQWLVRLERLSISHNRIHTLNAKTFHSTSAMQVRWLNLGYNKISTMHTYAFENLPNLEQLLLNDNRLTSLQPQIISSLRNLRYLTLAQNQINETLENAFANLPLLESLSLAHNHLRTMKEGIFHRVPNLTRLDLSHNRIESFDLDFLEDNVRQLTLLDLSHNVIRKLDISPARKSLIKLEIQNNQLEYIDDKILSNFDKLASIDLSHNDLIEVQSIAFSRSLRLERIILANNNLRNIWKGTFSDQLFIRTLDLSGNAFQTLEDNVFGRDNVGELRLARNQFTSVPIRALSSTCHSLYALDISYNAIKTLEWSDFKELTNLTQLILHHNHIETLEEEVFREMVRLTHLDLSSNPIATWNPQTFLKLSDNIEWINLANTGLFSLPEFQTRGLRSLNVSANRIYEIHPKQVENFARLTSLDLSNNNLLEMKPSTCQMLRELKHLNLSGNEIRVLQQDHFALLEQLETLNLGDMNALLQIPEPAAFGALRHLQQFSMYNMPQVAHFPIKEILEYLPPLRSLRFEFKAPYLSGEIFENVDTRLLRRITISGFRMKKLDEFTFARLRGFRVFITIRDTSVTHFPSEIVRNMSGVALLNLALLNNSIETLNPFDNAKPPVLNDQGLVLETIDFRDNPLVCDCRLSWLVDWIEYHLMENSAHWSEVESQLAATSCSSVNQHLHSPAPNRKNVSVLDVYGKQRRTESVPTNLQVPYSSRFSDAGVHCNVQDHLVSGQRFVKTSNIFITTLITFIIQSLNFSLLCL